MEKAREMAEQMAQDAMDRFKIFKKKDDDSNALKDILKGPCDFIFDPESWRIYFEDEYTKYKG